MFYCIVGSFFCLVYLTFIQDKQGNLFFSKGGLIFAIFFSNQIQRAKQETSEILENWIYSTQVRYLHRSNPSCEVSAPRSSVTGGSDKTYTSLICRQTKTAMTDAGDNDTSVIRGRSIMKGRGWDSHGAACNSRLCCSLYIRGVENK